MDTNDITPASVADFALMSKTGTQHFTAAKMNLIFSRNRQMQMSDTGRKIWIFILRRDRQMFVANNESR